LQYDYVVSISAFEKEVVRVAVVDYIADHYLITLVYEKFEFKIPRRNQKPLIKEGEKQNNDKKNINRQTMVDKIPPQKNYKKKDSAS